MISAVQNWSTLEKSYIFKTHSKSCFCRERKPSENEEKETEKFRIPIPQFLVSLNRKQINKYLHPLNQTYSSAYEKTLRISPITSLHLEAV